MGKCWLNVLENTVLQEMTRNIDLLYSYSLKQNSHKICPISSHFCLQITLASVTDDKCGHDRRILTFTMI